MTQLHHAIKQRRASFALSVILMGAACLSLSCGGKTTTSALPGTVPGQGLPIPPVAGPANAYVGKQTSSPSHVDPSLWTVSIDHNTSKFTYGNGTIAQTGGFVPLNGFLLMQDQNGYQKGLALEVPGRMAILRPGDSTTAPVFAVQQTECFPVVGNVKFQFALSPGSPTGGQSAFGRIYARTGSDLSSWNFDGQAQYQGPNGRSVPANAYIPSYPSSYSGKCAAASNAAAVTVSATAEYSIPTHYLINEAGYFLETQSYTDDPVFSQYGDVAAWGVVEPLMPLKTSTVASASYLGFLFEANNGVYLTRPVGFGGLKTSGSVMSGGAFLNENPINPPGVEMTLNFGAQDALNNGLYYTAKLTLPMTAGASCTSPGTDSSGNLTCTYNAVATVGNPEERFVIFLTAFDGSGHQKILVLVQQL